MPFAIPSTVPDQANALVGQCLARCRSCRTVLNRCAGRLIVADESRDDAGRATNRDDRTWVKEEPFGGSLESRPRICGTVLGFIPLGHLRTTLKIMTCRSQFDQSISVVSRFSNDLSAQLCPLWGTSLSVAWQDQLRFALVAPHSIPSRQRRDRCADHLWPPAHNRASQCYARQCRRQRADGRWVVRGIDQHRPSVMRSRIFADAAQ